MIKLPEEKANVRFPDSEAAPKRNVDINTDPSAAADLIRSLWRVRVWFLYPALAAALLSIVAIAAVNFSSPSTTSYRFAVTVTMPGASAGNYASGLPYAPTDMRSASVLDEVFRRNQLDQYGLDKERFSSMVFVQGYSPVQASAIDRYRAQLGVRNLTAEERRRLEEEFAAALRRISLDGAMVTFTVPDNLKIPREIGLKVAADIPAVWASIYIDVLGVGQPAIPRSEALPLDIEFAKNLDYPLMFDYVALGLDRALDRLTEIQNLPGAMSVVYKDKNVTALDLLGKAERIRDVEIGRVLRPMVDGGLTRDRSFAIALYEKVVRELASKEKLALKRVENITEALGRPPAEAASRTGEAPLPNAGGPFGSGGQSPPNVTSIPQLSDSFIDRIVSLALNRAELDFRQKLLRQQLTLAEAAARATKQRMDAENRLRGLQNSVGADTDWAKLAKQFDATLTATVGEINTLWADTNGVLDAMGTRNLGSDRQLYTSSPLEQPVTRTAFWRSPYLLIGAIGFVVAIGILGLALQLLRELVRRPSRMRDV